MLITSKIVISPIIIVFSFLLLYFVLSFFKVWESF